MDKLVTFRWYTQYAMHHAYIYYMYSQIYLLFTTAYCMHLCIYACRQEQQCKEQQKFPHALYLNYIDSASEKDVEKRPAISNNTE